MQTFLPYKDFADSAKSLDNKRLGKQRVENLTIMSHIIGNAKSNAWKNHPAVKMWKGFAWAFFQYHKAICNEWTGRGFRDTCLHKMTLMVYDARSCNSISIEISNIGKFPEWIGNEDFHKSHRQALKYKNQDFYAHFSEDPKLDYIWPV